MQLRGSSGHTTGTLHHAADFGIPITRSDGGAGAVVAITNQTANINSTSHAPDGIAIFNASTVLADQTADPTADRTRFTDITGCVGIPQSTQIPTDQTTDPSVAQNIA